MSTIAIARHELIDTDPPVPTDGTCAGCGRHRRPERSKPYGREAAKHDPFCSRSCCEIFYGLASRAAPSDEIEELSEVLS